MNNNNNFTPFIPFLDFNHPVITELDQKIRPLLDSKPTNLNRELQIRTMVYIDFNKYLTLLITKAEPEAAHKVLEQLETTPTADRLELVTAAAKQPIEKITNNFMALLNQKD